MDRGRLVRNARTHLRRVDPVLARVIDAVGPYRPADRTGETHYEALSRASVFQQSSGTAAGTFHGRLLALFPNQQPTAALLLDMPDETLRGVGLSRQKIGYLRALASRVQTGSLPLEHVETLSD